MAEPRELVEYQSDHDLLIRVDERSRNIDDKVGAVDKKIDKLVDSLEEKNNDHESRLRGAEEAIVELSTTQKNQADSSRIWRWALSISIALGTLIASLIALLK